MLEWKNKEYQKQMIQRRALSIEGALSVEIELDKKFKKALEK